METSISLKQLRADLDVLLGLADNYRNSRETATAFTKLQEGKMHVGNCLFELQQAHLYKDSLNPTNKNIEPYHVDSDITPASIPGDWKLDGRIENIKILRRELDKYITIAKNLLLSQDAREQAIDNLFLTTFLLEAIIRMRESMNWYGMELGRIREEQNDNQQ